MLPLFIVSVGNAISQDFNGFFNSNTISMACFQSNNFINGTCSFLLFLFYLFFIKLFFLKWLPSMLFCMTIGLFLSLLAVSFKILSLVDTWYDFISEILSGVSYFLINPALLEFTIAQSPMHSRGMMVGVWYSSWAIGYIFSSCIRYPFKCQNHYLCSDFYYYLTQAVLLFVILIVFLFLAKHYKYRIRDNEVNIY
uniref:Major facilitator superfamily (MFS) profile domain-containing protein n=1 Tax=Amphimedon queenslandica TaxID=400682 RepID=A0A1X7V3D8_AMPQE